MRVMRDAYLLGYYRSYPHSGDVRLGPLPPEAEYRSEAEREMLGARRPVAHAIIVLPYLAHPLRATSRRSGDCLTCMYVVT
jgi:hypothetical protein